LNLPLARERGKKSTDPAEWLEIRDAVSYALDLLKVKAVCIDEAQHLMQADAAQKPSIQLDWLKSLTNRSNLLYILVGNFSLYDFCHLNGQLARRVREEQFCRYHLDQQADAVEFTSALKVLLEQVPLQKGNGLCAQEEQTFGNTPTASLLGLPPSEKPWYLISANRRRPRGHTAERGINGTRRLIDRQQCRDRRIDFAADGDKHMLYAYG